MLHLMFPANIPKTLNTSIGRNTGINIGIHMDKDIATIFIQQAGSLYSAHVIVVYTDLLFRLSQSVYYKKPAL